MASKLDVSVVIPSCDRMESVQRALLSLSQQTLPADRFEVIVVDDGSGYDPAEVNGQPFPFRLQFIRQENQGATIARNNGARHSRGEVLVFMDDDVTVSPPALSALAEVLERETSIVAVGTLISRCDGEANPFTRDAVAVANARLAASHANALDTYVHFTECNTQLLAVKHSDFLSLGMFRDPTGGWPNWDDVAFGYRAHLSGFRLLRSAQAIGEHWDYALAGLKQSCLRWQRASRSAVRLFRVHPDLPPHIPMLHDKTPIAWAEDRPALVVRKLARRVAAWAPVLRSQEQAIWMLERLFPWPEVLRPFYRWIQGSYMFLGFQEGLRSEDAAAAGAHRPALGNRAGSN